MTIRVHLHAATSFHSSQREFSVDAIIVLPRITWDQWRFNGRPMSNCHCAPESPHLQKKIMIVSEHYILFCTVLQLVFSKLPLHSFEEMGLLSLSPPLLGIDAERNVRDWSFWWFLKGSMSRRSPCVSFVWLSMQRVGMQLGLLDFWF